MATILVVDDDPNTRQLYSALLPPFGHVVLQAGDGREGLKLAQTRPPDLIVSDILMPSMNGYEFVSSLRKLPGFASANVIFQSASFLDHESRVLGASCGVKEFLTKPCDPEKILEAVHRTLDLPAYQPRSAPPAPPGMDPVAMMLDAFYEKGKNLDAVSVRLAALVEFGIQIAQLSTPDSLLEIAVQAARKVIGANLAGAGILTSDGLEFSYFHVTGNEDAAVVQRCNASGDSLRQIAIDRRVLRASNLEKHSDLHLPDVHSPVHNFMGLPIQSKGRSYGVIYVANKLGGGEFTKQDEHLLATIGARVAIGYENVLRERRLQEQMILLQREIERRRQAEDRFRKLVETSPMGILLCDAAGSITEANPQLQKMFGYSREELVGSPVEMLVPETLRKAHENHRSDYIAAPHARPMGFGVELYARRKNGTAFPVEVSLGLLTGTEHPMISSTIVDITERKKLQDQLRVSQRLEAVGQLAAGIAHDFNNILTCISGNTKLALADLPGCDTVQKNLEEIDKAASRATKVVRQILAFSRQDPPRRELIKISEVVEEAVRLLRAGLRANVAVQNSCAADIPAVLADSTQIHQIVMNLATNAADAMGDKQGILKINLERLTVDAATTSNPGLLPGAYVRFSISDNGCGMDERTASRIFEPFFTTKPLGSGTGLGLSVVHGIVQNHGGTITVETGVDKGTTFNIYLPVAAETTALKDCPSPSAARRGNGEHVLYVDDEEPLVLLATRMLQRLGYTVTGCNDPQKALALFRSNPNAFDAIVSDLSMPGMSGTDLAREILQIRPGIPVLMTSGYIRPEDRECVRQLGLPDLILKPDTIEELGGMLSRALLGTSESGMANIEPRSQPAPARKATSGI
ncbi:MAG TPA: response regulator [Candidatus Sulfotelmatobacter sp.]